MQQAILSRDHGPKDDVDLLQIFSDGVASEKLIAHPSIRF